MIQPPKIGGELLICILSLIIIIYEQLKQNTHSVFSLTGPFCVELLQVRLQTWFISNIKNTAMTKNHFPTICIFLHIQGAAKKADPKVFRFFLSNRLEF